MDAALGTGPRPRGRWALATGVAAVVLALTACGSGSAPGGVAPRETGRETEQPVGTTEPPAPSPAPVWPVPELTVLVPASGEGTPLGEYERHDIGVLVEQGGLDLDRALAVYQHQDDFMTFSEAVRLQLADRLAGAGFTTYEGAPAWVAFTGEVPPEAVALAQGLPLDVELRGGALLTEDERGRVTPPAMQAFADEVGTSQGWSGGMDGPTARFTIDYVPGGAKEPDEATAAAVVAAARAALGRDVPFTVEFVPDRTDPTDTQPATWFLPAGARLDPTTTSVEVLVDEQGCTSGSGAEGNTAPPVVEATDTEVRIGVYTYVRRGPQTCPGHPLAPLEVDLGGPLGDRTLVDAHGGIDDDLAPRGGDLVTPPGP